MWITSGRPIKNLEITCYLWHHEYSCYLGIGNSNIFLHFLYFLLFTYYFLSFWSIISSKFYCQRKCKWSSDSNANVSAAMVSFSVLSSLLCNCRHEILSENRHFHSIVANLVDPLFSIFKELAAGTLNLWGTNSLFQYSPQQPWHLLIPKAAISTTSGTLFSGCPWEQGGEQLISFSARISSATVIWHARPMWLVFFLTVVFFCFFFCTYSPCMLVLVFTALCLAPLDGIMICGFVCLPS